MKRISLILSLFVASATASLATGFMPNRGQLADTEGKLHPEVHHYLQGPGFQMHFHKNRIAYYFEDIRPYRPDLTRPDEETQRRIDAGEISRDKPDTANYYRMDLVLEGANPDPGIEASEPLSYYENFYLPHCADGILRVHPRQRLRYNDIYPNIDLVFYQTEDKQLKYDFVIHPGGDPADIRLRYEGAKSLRQTEDGQLAITTPLGHLREGKPVSFQGGEEVPTRFVVGDDNRVHYELGSYDRDRKLRIDPTIFWATLFPNDGFPRTSASTLDGNGHYYIAMRTTGTVFPLLDPGGGAYFDNTPPTAPSGSPSDIFLSKFTTDGVQIWGTWYGDGDGGTNAFIPETLGDGLAATSNGKIYLGFGSQGPNQPTLNPGAPAYFDNTFASGSDEPLLVRFDQNGVREWSTYFGSTSTSDPRGMNLTGITVDANDRLVVVGEAVNSNLPTQDPGGGAYFQASRTSSGEDLFIARFNTDLSLQWSTYYGSTNSDLKESAQLVADPDGGFYLQAGVSDAAPPLVDPGGGAYFDNVAKDSFQPDKVLVHFDANAAIQWGTIFGGAEREANSFFVGKTLALDAEKNLYITGSTTSDDFPTRDPGGGAFFQGTRQGTGFDTDAYIAKFDSSYNLIWSTYFGSSDGVRTTGEAVDVTPCGEVYMAISGQMAGLPTVDDGSFFQGTYSGAQEGYFARFSSAGAHEWGTYYGTADDEELRLIDVSGDGTQMFFVVERTDGTDATNPAALTQDPGGGAYFETVPENNWEPLLGRWDLGGALNPGFITWVGGIDNDWHKPCNWSPPQVPTPTDPVIVPDSPNDPHVKVADGDCLTIDIETTNGAELTIEAPHELEVHQ